MATEKLDEEEIVEIDVGDSDDQDPDAVAPKSRKLFTQPYDLTLKTLVDHIKDETLHLRSLSSKPFFQRRYVWSNKLASRLIESVILIVPIPPCYFAQDENFELEVIDGQQRIFSIYRFFDNQFALSNLEAITEINAKNIFELDAKTKKSNHKPHFTLCCYHQ